MAFSSSDVVLWKSAGATHCATGKFFNLRRFTKSRFDEPKEGGSQRPYWFEESLMAFLREVDVIRLERDGLLTGRSNPFGAEILETKVVFLVPRFQVDSPLASIFEDGRLIAEKVGVRRDDDEESGLIVIEVLPTVKG